MTDGKLKLRLGANTGYGWAYALKYLCLGTQFCIALATRKWKEMKWMTERKG